VEDVVVLLAVESGSRAWGFSSKDSDYDARFIYLRRPEAYLSIRAPRDVIERRIVDEVDVNGWDLRKALGLLMKSNPPLLEWLQCPIIYGLGPVHRAILDILRRHGRPMKAQRLARAAGLTLESFRTLYEPLLFELGAIEPTSRWR
jgi:predicted nucleotidyltransferase